MRYWPLAMSFLYLGNIEHIQAAPSVVLDPVPCVRDLALHFFNERLVGQALSLYNIRQELWSPITQTLERKSREVLLRIKRKTAFMVPNPFEYPMDRGMAARILKNELFAIFLETLREYQVQERPPADFAFDYILNEQLPQFIRCFGEEAIELKPHFD